MAGTKKINKSQKKHGPAAFSFAVLDGADGNPKTPLEHDNAVGYEGEQFFKADDEADEDAQKRVLILNFIHQELKHVTERKVPVLDKDKDFGDVEVYHRVIYEGTELDVCVFWPPRAEGDYKVCVAMVKYTTQDPSAEIEVDGLIQTDAAWNNDAKADKFTLKNDKLIKNYWAPRWKYVVNALKHTAYHRYEKNGDQKPLEPESIAEVEGANDNDSQEEKEEAMQVYVGSTGKIIGPKGAKIQEIKAASKVTDIKMPPKTEEGTPRPRARDLVDIILIGKPRAIAKARELVQAVVDEWANAPRDRGTFIDSAVPPYDPQDEDKFGVSESQGDWNGGGDDTAGIEQEGNW